MNYIAVFANGFDYEPVFRPSTSNFKNRNVLLFRLPDTTQPNWYDLTIITNLEDEFDFKGTVVIRVHVLSATREIILHSKDLDITGLELTRFPEQTAYSTTHSLNLEDQLLIINTAEQTLLPGTAFKLTIQFSGKLNDEMIGFYRSSYRDKKATK